MAEQTSISWCDHTFIAPRGGVYGRLRRKEVGTTWENAQTSVGPTTRFNIVWGCAKVSPGCAHCYAEGLSDRYGFDVWGPGKERRTFGEKRWAEPLKWNARAAKDGQRRRVFCSSMCDVFEEHPTIDHEREKLWRLIRVTPWLDWQLLTKRPERIADNLPADWGDGWPNVWLGTSIENNDYAWRADSLRIIPAAVRFVSYEPAIGPLDQINLAGIHWLIAGGESGPGRRPDDPAWYRDIRDRCRAEDVKFFFKQRSGPRPGMGDLDGELIREFPKT